MHGSGLLRRGACHRAAVRPDPLAPRNDEFVSPLPTQPHHPLARNQLIKHAERLRAGRLREITRKLSRDRRDRRRHDAGLRQPAQRGIFGAR